MQPALELVLHFVEESFGCEGTRGMRIIGRILGSALGTMRDVGPEVEVFEGITVFAGASYAQTFRLELAAVGVGRKLLKSGLFAGRIGAAAAEIGFTGVEEIWLAGVLFLVPMHEHCLGRGRRAPRSTSSLNGRGMASSCARCPSTSSTSRVRAGL
jgi:hypothetical protein